MGRATGQTFLVYNTTRVPQHAGNMLPLFSMNGRNFHRQQYGIVGVFINMLARAGNSVFHLPRHVFGGPRHRPRVLRTSVRHQINISRNVGQRVFVGLVSVTAWVRAMLVPIGGRTTGSEIVFSGFRRVGTIL